MSLQTWKETFYEDIMNMKEEKRLSDLSCAEHTLKKYQGLLPENLEKHGVGLFGRALREKNLSYVELLATGEFDFSSDTCSFCLKHYNFEYQITECGNCPIGRISKPCGGNNKENTWYQVIFTKDPNPMITLMEKIITMCDSEGKFQLGN